MEMGRARTRTRAGWPANLYPNREGYKYRHPVTRKETWMGQDKARAFAAAKKLNALLAHTNDLVSRVTGTDKTIADAIALFRKDDMPNREWAPKTAAEYKVVLNRIERRVGTREVGTFTVKDCATFIRDETESVRSRQILRLVLGWILTGAVEEGWAEGNVAEQTRKYVFKRQRDRLTIDAYKAIWAQAEPWLRNAMDLSLLTLLRREDIASAKFADVRDGALWVIPSKTEDSTLVKLAIALTEPLAALVARCRDDVVSPYLIHRLPEKARPQALRAKGRVHHTQLMPEQITREFKKARNAAGITGKGAPSFHEVRSLGGALLRDAGWAKEDVQALMGHASVEMTKLYLSGHDAPWQAVRPGIALPIG